MSSGVISAVATGAVSTHEFSKLGAQCFRLQGRTQLQSLKRSRHVAILDPDARVFVVQTMSCAHLLAPPASVIGFSTPLL
jgi:hypothetical protein